MRFHKMNEEKKNFFVCLSNFQLVRDHIIRYTHSHILKYKIPKTAAAAAELFTFYRKFHVIEND